MFSRLALALKDSSSTLVKLMAFGSLSAWPAAEDAMRRVFGKIDWPVTWVEGAACNNEPIAGLQAFAFTAGRVHPVTLNGRVVGSVFEDGAIRYCLLGGLGPQPGSASRPDQFRQTLANLETALARANFSLGDVVRTWFLPRRPPLFVRPLQPGQNRGLLPRQIPRRLPARQHRHFSKEPCRRRPGRRRLGASTPQLHRADRPSPLPLAMSGHRLRQLLQPRHGNLLPAWPPPLDLRHRQRCARGPDTMARQPEPANPDYNGSH